MAKVLTWRQFLLPPEKGGGSLSCAVSSRSDGRLCGLLKVGKNSDTTVLVRSEKPDSPLDVQLIRCSPSGCETAESIQPLRGRSNRYRIPLDSRRQRGVEIDVNRPSSSRLDVAVKGLGAEPHVLHYYGDRNLVTLAEEGSVAPSLMRGGSKLRIGRAHGYGMFAVEDIKAGEVVEEAPLLTQEAPFLSDYTFMAGDKYALPLGNIALYNHSDTPTCLHSVDKDSSVMTLTATRDIRAGEQLSISYGGDLWFESRGIKKAHLLESET